ncbi:DUF1365 domain-containing protein [Pedobacter metabolipauper]|nr:DUF1365 domain-containing protein [Pedobacter metabolipauper]
MNSSLYICKVMHNRLSPKKHHFWYKVYLFYIDLDEIGLLSKKLRWIGHNRFNLFNFRDKDHLQLPAKNPDPGKSTREHLTRYLLENQVVLGRGSVMLLTNLSVLGYNFNPVSFYFCQDEHGKPLCAVVEISNTFHEMKLFFIGKDELEGGRWVQRVEKYFYVSPFIDLDTLFDFNLGIPGEKLDIRIDDYDKNGQRFFLSTLTGTRKPLTNANLLRYFFSIPLIPLRVMGLIHWQAFLLWRKDFSFHKKSANHQLQKDVYKPYKPTN